MSAAYDLENHKEMTGGQKIAEYGRLQRLLFEKKNSLPREVTAFGWDIEYMHYLAVLNALDFQVIRKTNDFFTEKKAPLILDCGANIGLSILRYKSLFPEARIIAFEPDPQFLPVLKGNLSRNHVNDVQLVEAAVWVENGFTNWYCEGIEGSKILQEASQDNRTVTVSTVDINSFLNEEVDLLKLDVEGAEYEIIRHIDGCLHNVRNLVVECHLNQEQMADFADVISILCKNGFRVGINSYGAWVDLIRHPPERKSYQEYDQYILVSATREPIREYDDLYSTPPNLPAELIFRLSELEGKERSLSEQVQIISAERDHLYAINGEIAQREMILAERMSRLDRNPVIKLYRLGKKLGRSIFKRA